LTGRDQEGHCLKPAQVNSLRDPISKKKQQKWAGGVAQVVEHLPSKCEAMSSITNKTKNKNMRNLTKNWN
jgi:hypothetical protein